jgi:hypothetical protein
VSVRVARMKKPELISTEPEIGIDVYSAEWYNRTVSKLMHPSFDSTNWLLELPHPGTTSLGWGIGQETECATRVVSKV